MNSIPNNARVFVAGKTGTGKSYLTESYLRNYDYVIKLDTQDETSERRALNKSPWRGLKEGKDFTCVSTLEEVAQCTTKKIIYTPDITEQSFDDFDKFFEFVYRRENTIVWIDELMSISNSPLKVPFYLKACYTRGRSKQIGIWALSQRPADIPAVSMANSEVFIAFRLRLLSDREKLMRMTGCPEFLEDPATDEQPYAFWYFQDDWDYAVRAELSE